MQDPRITYFPVGNGDCSLIQLSDNTHVLIDCNITDDSRDGNEPTRYDVHAHLVKFGKKLTQIPHVDAFILTHSDEDHCRGFDTTFHTGDPSSYSKRHLKSNLILIDELWFTRRIFAPHEGKLSLAALSFRREAQRRIDLHKRQMERAQRHQLRKLPSNARMLSGGARGVEPRPLKCHQVLFPSRQVIRRSKNLQDRKFENSRFG